MTEFDQKGNTSREMNTVLMPDILKNGPPIMDDVHSFVLRVSRNPAPDGQGAARPRFRLEYVNQDINQRMQNLDEVFKELTTRIELILRSSDGDLN